MLCYKVIDPEVQCFQILSLLIIEGSVILFLTIPFYCFYYLIGNNIYNFVLSPNTRFNKLIRKVCGINNIEVGNSFLYKPRNSQQAVFVQKCFLLEVYRFHSLLLSFQFHIVSKPSPTLFLWNRASHSHLLNNHLATSIQASI